MHDSRTTRKGPNQAARFGMAASFLGVGVMHFVRPEFFDAIIPEEIPAPRLWTYATGVAEIAGGATLAIRPTRRLGWLLVGLLALVFPANINQALRGVQIDGAAQIPRWALFARLPLQFVMVWAVLAGTRPEPTAAPSAPVGS